MKLFKKHLPTREQLKEMKSLQFLGHMMFESNLWHFNRHSLSFAALVGGFWCFIPIPFQTIPAVLLCVWIRCNIPLTVTLVWSSNPLTMPAMMIFAYGLGTDIMGAERIRLPESFSMEWLTSQLIFIWQPLLLGSLVCGLVTGLTGFLLVQFYYRWRVARYKQRRRERKPGDITRF